MNPQLPITAVVTPCQHDDVPSGSQNIWASMCVCPSMKPGVTTWPLGVELAASPLGQPADRHDAPAAHADIGAEGRHAGAVDHGAVADHEVVRVHQQHASWSSTRGSAANAGWTKRYPSSSSRRSTHSGRTIGGRGVGTAWSAW